MQRFEYKVIPAPRRGEKIRGAKSTSDRFAATLTQVMNELGRDGWDYLRVDTLPCEERVGFTGKTTTFQHMLVFRRALDAAPVAETATPAAYDPVPTFFRRDAAPQPAALAATLTARAADTDLPRAPEVVAPLGAAPAIGPARDALGAEQV